MCQEDARHVLGVAGRDIPLAQGTDLPRGPVVSPTMSSEEKKEREPDPCLACGEGQQ